MTEFLNLMLDPSAGGAGTASSPIGDQLLHGWYSHGQSIRESAECSP
jgi:hypothetical protein